MLNLRRSRLTTAAVIGLHLFAVAAIIAAAIALWIKLVTALLILASLLYNLHANRIKQTLVWHKDDHWHITRGDDIVQHANLSRIDFFSRWLVIITLICPARSRLRKLQKFVIPADSLDANTFRLLRVRLRIEAIPMLQAPPERPLRRRR